MAKLIGGNRQGFANNGVISTKDVGTESIPGPTSDSDFYIASDSATESQHKIIHINDNKVVAGWIDGSNRPYVAVGSVGSDGTTTWGTPSAVNGTTTSVDIDLVHLADDKFMVLYDEGGSLSGFGSDHYLYGKVGSISSTTVSSYGTAVRLDVDVSSTYRGLDRDSSHALKARTNIYSAVRIGEDKVFLAYRRSFAFGRRILTVSGTTITLVSHSNLMYDGSKTARNIRCAVSPDDENNVVVFYSWNNEGRQVVRAFVIDGTSVSQSSETYVSQGGINGNSRVFLGMDGDAFDICWLNSTKFAYTLRLSHPAGSDGKNSSGSTGTGYASGYSEGDVVVAVFEFNGTGTIGSTGANAGTASIMATNSDSGARLARINDTKIAAIYRNDDDSNTLYYRIGTLGGSDAIVWDTAVDTNLTGSVGFKTISITKNIRSSDARLVLFVKTATAFTGGHTDNAVSSTIQGFDAIVTYRDTTKFLSSVWSLKDQNKKMSKGEWIRNDVDTGTNAKGRSIKGSGLEVFGHRHYAGPAIFASGGNEVTTPTHKYHVFASPGTFTMTGAEGQVEYLVIGGGGGGGAGGQSSSLGGGGGAGGLRTGYLDPLTPGAYPITVGSGGNGGPPGSPTGTSGGSSIFATITSAGGGGGGLGRKPNSQSEPGAAGGSGGGHGSVQGSGGNFPARAAGNTPPTTPPQGNPGGFGASDIPGSYPDPNVAGTAVAGGGGGAGSAGFDGGQVGLGHGGEGTPLPQFPGSLLSGVVPGDSVTAVGPTGIWASGGGAGHSKPGGDRGQYLGGVGGPKSTHPAPNDHGQGGGGYGGSPSNSGQPGANGTGGGGGGGMHTPSANRSGESGGNGIVIIRYLKP